MPEDPKPGDRPPQPENVKPHVDEPDDDPSLFAAMQSDQGAKLPRIAPFPAIPDPPSRLAALAIPRLQLSVTSRRVRLGPRGQRFDVHIRRGRSRRWRPLRTATAATVVRLPKGTRAVSARLRLPDGRPAGWVTRRARR